MAEGIRWGKKLVIRRMQQVKLGCARAPLRQGRRRLGWLARQAARAAGALALVACGAHQSRPSLRLRRRPAGKRGRGEGGWVGACCGPLRAMCIQQTALRMNRAEDIPVAAAHRMHAHHVMFRNGSAGISPSALQ